ncbi:hypothetical protein HYFRA_00006708 [Hymenoscyphus fraxineus]|uniref:Uncharacterized protein n=1 Tax=Hymenoscyphus fraxineus TaxID=746836 RepID=A0A9N9KU97_9HELO|nr:hypothetical protein HYFRA_00006708 [Hymenoscyphus fraxineus]
MLIDQQQPASHIRERPLLNIKDCIAQGVDTLECGRYDERTFPSLFQEWTLSSVTSWFDNDGLRYILPRRRYHPPRPGFLYEWFRQSDKFIFFGRLSKHWLAHRLQFERFDGDGGPPLDFPCGAYYKETTRTIFVDVNHVLNNHEIAVFENSWHAWAISALLHQMLHAFMCTFAQPGFIECAHRGNGRHGHGLPFLISMLNINNALRSVLGDRLMVSDQELGPDMLESMVMDAWRPDPSDLTLVEEMRTLGIPDGTRYLLVHGFWSDPDPRYTPPTLRRETQRIRETIWFKLITTYKAPNATLSGTVSGKFPGLDE